MFLLHRVVQLHFFAAGFFSFFPLAVSECFSSWVLFHLNSSFSACIRLVASGRVSVMPFPIFVWSAFQRRMSYFGSAPFQLTSFSSVAQPPLSSLMTAILRVILYVMSFILFLQCFF